jgi:hypothetical protein
MIALVAAVLLGMAPSPARPAPADPYVYRAVFLQAAPGRLLELVDLFKATLPVYDAAGLPRPLLGRHTQGDRWDILVVEPVGSLASFYAHEPATQWERMESLVAWREELFVSGPPLEEFERRNTEGGFYHLEIFLGLAAKRDSLYRQRLMEDDYSRRIGRPDNLVFTRVGGAAWDLFTIGFYRSLQHYAEPSNITVEQDEAAAKAAGFASRNDIGAYLRRFIALHHDTLLVPIR